MFLIKTVTWIFLAVLLVPAIEINSQVPRLINYQGVVLDETGGPIADGSHAFSFRIYNALSGGTSLWSETGMSISVLDGLFTYELGAATPFPPNLFVNKDSSLYLEVAVDGQIQSPRTRLTSVPFAETAGNLNCQSPYTGGSIYRTYPFSARFSTFGSDGLEQTRLWGDEWGELVLFNSSPQNGPSVLLSANGASGGLLVLSDSADFAAISLDAGQSGDGSVMLPDNSISPLEMFAEPGVANHIGTNFFTDLTIPNVDYKVDSVTISIPADGYVEVTAGCYVIANHFEGIQTDIFVGVSKTQNIDYFVPGCVVVGISHAHPDGVIRMPAFSTRLYSETAGAHTYYLIAERNAGGDALTNIANPSIVAKYFPTAYGNIATTTFDNSPRLPDLPRSLNYGAPDILNPYLKIQTLEEINNLLKNDLSEARLEIERLKKAGSPEHPKTQKEMSGQTK